MKLSIIIPTLNEAEYCGFLFRDLKKLAIGSEIIVVDGGSDDATQKLIRDFGFDLLVTKAGRARQLALGASRAKGDFLLFLHADVRLERKQEVELDHAILNSVELASFPITFDTGHWFLRFNAFFSKFSHPYFHFGDQGLWISRSLYEGCGGFNPKSEVLEDQDIYQNACKISRPKKFKSRLTVSARKYREYGVIPLQCLFYRLWLMSKMGFSRKRIDRTYRNFLSIKKPNDT